MKDWKFIKTGNVEPKLTDISGKDGSGVVERMSNKFFVSYKLNNGEKGIEKFDTESQAIAFLKKKVGNESIDKQEWSMFKGLTKDAEKEVGNELPTEQDLKNWIRMSQQDMKDAQREMEKNKPLGHPDSYREENYGRAKVKYDEAAKAIKKMEEELRQGKYKKVGNARSKEQLLADVRELTKYINDNQDRPCEKEKRLLGEAKEELDKRYGVIVGNFKTGKSKLSIGDKVSLYGVKGTVKGITGENSDNIYGEPVIEFESEDGKTKQVPEHYLVKVGNALPHQIADILELEISRMNKGEYDTAFKRAVKDLERIGVSTSEARGYAGDPRGWVRKIYEQRDLGNDKVCNETLGQWAKAKPRIINDESTRMRNEYNAEIQRLTKKAEELRRMGQGRSAMEVEKQIEKLGKELRELGNKKTGNAGQWNSTKTIYGKWDDKAGRPAEEYARITWLGQGKGGLVNIWKGNQMTSEKYGSNDLEDLRRWAEQRIGNETKGERKFGKVMGEFERGELKSGSGEKVTDPEQAKAIAYREADKVDNLKRARNAMAKNQKITLWKGNDTVYISEDGTVQYLENNAFETDRDKFESKEKAIEELTKQGYRNK